MHVHIDTPAAGRAPAHPTRIGIGVLRSLGGRPCLIPILVFAVAWAPVTRAVGQDPVADGEEDARRETRPTPPEASAPAGPVERMAAGLPPFDVPAFGLGAAITFFTPGAALGVGSISATYDLGPVHFDALFGLVWDDAGPNSLSGSLRAFVLLHRGPIADFSVGLGGSLGYIEREDGATDLTWQIMGGGKIRVFVGGKNVAISATIGAGVSFVDDSGVVVVGGRLLGSAGFVYFFR
jgi:hypothetical protein